jgi:hypothetical protein
MDDRFAFLRRVYYICRPFVPRSIQIMLRRRYVAVVRKSTADVWPIDVESGRVPSQFRGWPEQKDFALVLRHDVESAIGHNKCLQLMEIEKKMGLRSAFYFVPLRYAVSQDVRKLIVQNEFEVGVHGLKHDGKLFENQKTFEKRSRSINSYLSDWNAVGFTSPSSISNLEWMRRLKIRYSSSTFDTDPFEPQPRGAGTIFPIWVGDCILKNGFVELPYTMPQDFTLFALLKERSDCIWRKKIDWIASIGGMVLLNTHPDYMNFEGKQGVQNYPASHYVGILQYIQDKYRGRYWNTLPSILAEYWRESVLSDLHGKIKDRNREPRTACMNREDSGSPGN